MMFLIVGMAVGAGAAWVLLRRAPPDPSREALIAAGLATAGLAHDLRNVSMTIEGFAEIARKHEGSRRLEAIGVVLDHARLLRTDLQDFLELANPEAKPRRTRLVDSLAFAVKLLSPVAQSRDRTLAHEIDPSLALEVEDPEFRRAVVNVVLNALEFSKNRVTFGAWAEGSDVVVRVTDDGPGVPAGDRSRIFEPFTSLRGGTGLGLSSARAAITRARGAITVEDAPGGGAMFVIRLPAP